jgi:glycosyltransferase involved in cell wall biosynthesis
VDILVCGAQKPFVRGGAELAQENLVTALTAAGHRAELVRLPVAWEKGRLFDSPVAWRAIPADADLVIATNFPSYFVRHPRKVVWLFHQHRGAFDAADAAWSDFDLSDDALETQRLMSDWDRRALAEASHVYALSAVVAERLERFVGLSATPLHHPAPLQERLHPGPFGDYVCCATRLEANKRPELVVAGVAEASSGIRAVVAGRGELADALAEQVRTLGVENRVDLPGFVADDDLVELFAGALAVIYAPLDEDYGYVTLQAFAAGKPVITAADSGAVLDWVEDGVTGFVTDGSPQQIGAAIDRLAGDRALARRMGEAGRARVAGLSWPVVVDRLLEGA